jgi:Flagellar protein FliT
MVVLEFFELKQKLSDLLLVIGQLNELAEKELWDDLLVLWPRYEALSHHLPQIDWERLSIAEQQLLQESMLNLDSAHTHLMVLTLAWRDELQDILQTTVQSRKLNNHYR